MLLGFPISLLFDCEDGPSSVSFSGAFALQVLLPGVTRGVTRDDPWSGLTDASHVCISFEIS